MTRYAELQAVSNFSFLRGGSHAEELAATAKALGLEALAVADRNTLAGIVRAHTAAKQVGLRLVVGARLDLQDAPSLLVYPTDRAAYGRLCRLLTLGQGRAEKGDCTLFLDDVAAHAQGQVFTALAPAGAPAGVAAFAPALARLRDALDAPLHLAASHAYRGDDRTRIAALDRLARQAGVALVATGDVLYHAAHRRPLQDVLTCIREKCTIQEAGLRLEVNAERHLKAPQEMARLFQGYEDALTRACEIAEACRFSLDELVYEYPDEPVPAGKTPQAHLEDLTWAGAAERYPEGLPPKIEKTLARELALIGQLGYAPYFLTVHDIVRFAREKDIL
ncbi:MAG: PHP domain-containing protein, partial [Hyphomicrobiales bacterium]|nr:PHP domain-containing protein [Hyphomicrobiales bacterium]